MAISSVLNPQNIIGNRKGTAEKFQNFMTGGNSSLGSSIVNSTSSNKIVPFERGGVRPITSDFNSIVSTISTKTDTALNTNIKNQDNKVQGVVNNIQNVFQTTLQNFTKGYQEKLKSIEESKPSGILEKFFGLYNNVTGFIQFFGDRKNLNKISDSLKGLRGLFEDSFETAKLIRKIINKIVKQLSSIPVATPSGGGGFNLDIKVPGSPLKSAAGKALGGGRGKMLALGAGALGTGMLAGGAINALSGSENIQPAAVQQSIPDNLADSLSSIVDRFVSAIDNLIKSAGSKPKSTPKTSGGGGGGGGGGAPSPSPGPGGPTAGGNYGSAGAEAVKNFAATQGYSPEFTSGLLSTVEKESGFNPYAIGDSGNSYGLFQFNTGRREPFLKFLEQAGIKKPQELFANPNSDRAKQEKDKVFNLTLEYMMQREQGTQIVRDLSKSKDLRTIMGGFEDIERYSGSQPTLPRGQRNNLKYNDRLERAKGYLKSGVSGTSIQTPQVAPAPTQTKAKVDAISQPVKPQSKVTNLSMPAEVSSAGGQSQGGGGGGGGSAPPPPSGGSPSVPFLPAGNVDNFLVLYSKMVYNIVDG